MATSPSQQWENGVLVSRAVETNRWRVNPDGSEVEGSEVAEIEPKATKRYKAPVATKQVAEAENKSTAKKARKR